MSKKESVLIKEFAEKDIARVRNLVNKKFGDKTVQQVGYKKSEIVYIEGDIWEERNKTWTIKNGIKQTITKLDNLKQILQLPLVCPKCSKPMKNKELDKKMFFLHKMCFNCVINHETELKRNGKFEDYQSKLLQEHVLDFIKDLEQDFLEFCLSQKSDSFITEQGDIEKWDGGDMDFDKMSIDLKEYIQKLKTSVGL